MQDEAPQSSTNRARILCLDHDTRTGAAIAAGLAERGLAVTAVSTGLDAVAEILRHAPNLVLLDARSAGKPGVDLLERLMRVAPCFASIPFVFLTAPRDRIDEFMGRPVGSERCVTKPVDFDLLETVIKANVRPARAWRKARPKAALGLKHREIETLTWAARGKTSAQIAEILGLAKRTVDFHLDNARKALRVATRTEAAIKAAQDRLIKP